MASSFSSSSSSSSRPLDPLAAYAEHSWLEYLSPDPDAISAAPNKRSREVKAGHWIPVLPSPLPEPTLVLHSRAMAAELGLDDSAVATQEFARFFSGDIAAGAGAEFSAIDAGAYAEALASDPKSDSGSKSAQAGLPLLSWCTPYALSIMGTPYYNNCPFGNGNGYGDGRAISVGEVVVPAHARLPGADAPLVADGPARRWEMQLKGGGPTPFCRGADGRAVLRSSIREFLASEAMHALRVPTTRALSLVCSGNPSKRSSSSERSSPPGSDQGEFVRRGWYSGRAPDPIDVTEDDPRLARFPAAMRSMLIKQLRDSMGGGGNTDPDVAIMERCAITCRVSPSFLRVGHLDLFSRRFQKAKGSKDEAVKQPLRDLVDYMAFREFPEVVSQSSDDAEKPKKLTSGEILTMLETSAHRIAYLMGEWLRVGFSQGNFNADNCLVGGRTMDYGPFGFLEAYDPGFAKWTGSGDHFAFANQPQAGFANWQVLAKSVAPVYLERGGTTAELQSLADRAADAFGAAVERTWRAKLGFGFDGSLASSGLKEPSPVPGTFGTSPEAVAAAAAAASPEGALGKADAAAEAARPVMPLFGRLEKLLQRSRVDFTIFFRQLAAVVELTTGEAGNTNWVPETSSAFNRDAALVAPLSAAFEGEEERRINQSGSAGGNAATGGALVSEKEWAEWLRDWLRLLAADEATRATTASTDSSCPSAAARVAARMRLQNPRFVPREWMLVEAYDAAASGDFEPVQRLLHVLSKPYQDASPLDPSAAAAAVASDTQNDERFFRRDVTMESKPGIAFMT